MDRYPSLNVLGGKLEECSHQPKTGFFRDGCCDTGPADVGSIEAGKYDAAVVHSGTPMYSFQDDYEYAFRPNPHFLAWLPLTAARLLSRLLGHQVHLMPGPHGTVLIPD